MIYCNQPLWGNNYKITNLKSKNAQSFYVVKSTYINKKSYNKIVEKIGTLKYLKLRIGNSALIQCAKNYVTKLTEEEKMKLDKYFFKKLKM